MKIIASIRKALRAGKPVVALETAVLTHGLPRPFNLQVARECEAAVREAGALPATVAVFEGQIRAGLEDAELERLARDEEAEKCGARDLGALVARGVNGGTTVSGTLAVAAAAGIPVMSTGGIGGVHRGEGAVYDISADLPQLARSAVTAVCAGAKAILDLGRTFEQLETLGIPVLGYRTWEFPGFYVKETGLRLTHRFDSVRDLARAIQAYRAGRYQGGILVVQPPPESLSPQALEEALGRAIVRQGGRGITGPEVTPFLLAALAEETGGRTLEINRLLLQACARLAGKIAAALSLSRAQSGTKPEA